MLALGSILVGIQPDTHPANYDVVNDSTKCIRKLCESILPIALSFGSDVEAWAQKPAMTTLGAVALKANPLTNSAVGGAG